ncbi:cobyrinate a,c-diamide synthase [Pararhizobium mangrovi]|uniref:Hydrogenobyrinate a,c-diamide synthase n=1 Tax=Pararhizobium mangrovi TaxID=2590452 RepID=A0A506UCH2_9HYPH|nr:cobyrinate a,c-diamide synthase [Pararhizobium mangrovi]TPW31298.1 cobyrinate a,c-diamide synthase [Pararhizobium mangrovi]
MNGIMIAAPASGSGKTTVTLGLLRALVRRGVAAAPGKAGPDYIDPAFHTAASDEVCLNFDPWASEPASLVANAALSRRGGRMLVVEAMMGLYDGAADGTATPADLAVTLSLPVILVVDCAKLSHSVAALVEGHRNFREMPLVAGVILNRVGSDRHEAMLRSALDARGIRVFGALRRDDALSVPERHLGLVQASEHGGLEAFIERAGDAVEAGVDCDALVHAAGIFAPPVPEANIERLPPPGSRIAIARDTAFAFVYEHLLLGWRRRGAEIRFFSPLADEAPPTDCDAVYLPGGYPELHAGRIAAASTFHAGTAAAIERGAWVYGECGGYMVLGEGLTDEHGVRHAMLGALPLETQFTAGRPRTLGYRKLQPRPGFIWSGPLRGHAFHYATTQYEGQAERLFDIADACGNPLGAAGLRRGKVAGSFMHVVDRAGSTDG